jgi:ketosteroid isomerase-like protein
MRTVYIAMLATFLVMHPLAEGQTAKSQNNDDKSVQEIVDFRNHYIEAEENKDVAYLDKVLVDDYFALNTQGQLMDKSHQLANVKRTDRTLKVMNPRETQVRFYNNGQLAILTEHVTVDGEDKGHHFGGEFRFLRVFTKQSGNWQVVLAQGSPIPQAPDAK